MVMGAETREHEEEVLSSSSMGVSRESFCSPRPTPGVSTAGIRTMLTVRISLFCAVVVCLAVIVGGADPSVQLFDNVDLDHSVRKLEGLSLQSEVSWVVQLSDLHISRWRPERLRALNKLMGKILATIQPALVLITGDLTDAKSKKGTSTGQYEDEWIGYRDFIDLMVKESGLSLNQFYDLRGNHDKYGVPEAGSSLDYYSQYSCNARMGRTSLVQSVTLLGRDGWKHLFVGVDDSMSVGLRGPSNMFGHPSDATIAKLDKALGQWSNDTSAPVAKIVFGHFPISFTASSGSGQRSDEIMAKNKIAAFINGHLHTKFGRKLYKHHVRGINEEFWEWEMGDWRASRMMRVLAVDHGRVSFVDVDLSQYSKQVLRGENFTMPTIILPTSPLDSRMMLRVSAPRLQIDEAAIRVLVFSRSLPLSVYARLLDSAGPQESNLVGLFKMVEVSGSAEKAQGGPFLYEAAWVSKMYSDPSPLRYWLQVEVVDSSNSSTLSHKWPFSVEGRRAPFKLSFPGFIVMGFQWEFVFPIVLWTMFAGILGCLLILPQLALIYMEKQGSYDHWSVSLFHRSTDSNFPYVKLPLWALVEGARNRYLWTAQVIYIALLLVFPWFWARVLADDYPIGYMTVRGWTVWPSKSSVASQSGLGWPDVLGIVMPYLGCVIFPFVLMVSALCAEQGACELVTAITKGEVGSGEEVQIESTRAASETLSMGREDEPLMPSKDRFSGSLGPEEGVLESPDRCSFSRGVRKFYFIASLAIALLHLRLCLFMISSYGAQAILLSPFYVWPVPVLLMVCLYSTSTVNPRALILTES